MNDPFDMNNLGQLLGDQAAQQGGVFMLRPQLQDDLKLAKGLLEQIVLFAPYGQGEMALEVIPLQAQQSPVVLVGGRGMFGNGRHLTNRHGDDRPGAGGDDIGIALLRDLADQLFSPIFEGDDLQLCDAGGHAGQQGQRPSEHQKCPSHDDSPSTRSSGCPPAGQTPGIPFW